MTDRSGSASRRTSPRWFIAATLVVALGPWILGAGDPTLWLQLVCLGVGTGLLAVGGFVRRREIDVARGRR